MDKNADFSQPILLHTRQLPWLDSPMPGVRRRMLDRVGGEVARATSIVRYAPHSRFSPHVHTGGEEFIVLEGVFQDEHGDYPAGTYVRNPPLSQHTPRSKDGCVIFVKLWQFDPEDRQTVRLDMNSARLQHDDDRPGVHSCTLFRDDREAVSLEHWKAGARIAFDATGGAELLLLGGDATYVDRTLEQLSWLRLPTGTECCFSVGTGGARVWIKTGHLRFADEERARLP